MQNNRSHTPLAIVIALIVGWLLGTSGVIASKAEEITPTSTVQGTILNVCINKKSGAIRAATKCVAKTERKTVLGGVGAQGEVGPQGEQGETGSQGIQGVKGDTGAQGTQGIQGIQGEMGPQGLQGLTGQTGAAGSVSGLRTKEISFVSRHSSECSGITLTGISLLDNRTSISTSQFLGTSLNKSCTTFSYSTERVLVP